MKLTKKLVKAFEQEQQRWGTHTALFNILWAHARENLRDIGVTRVRTENGTEADKGQTGVKKASKAGRNGKAAGRGRAQKPVRKPSQGIGTKRTKAEKVGLGHPGGNTT